MADEKKVEDKRFFLGPDDAKYYIIPPNANDIREADWHYSRIYAKSLMEGITTSAEMMDILRRRGVIGPEFEQRAQELSDNLNERLVALDSAADMDTKRELAVEVAEARDELFQWNQRLNGPMANTCEQMSDDARLEYLTSCMIADDKGDRVWDSHDNYLKEKDQALALKSRFEVMLYLQGLESDFLDNTPEAVAMKEVQDDIIAKAAEASKALEAVAKEEEKAAEKPAPRRKTTRRPSSRKKKEPSKE